MRRKKDRARPGLWVKITDTGRYKSIQAGAGNWTIEGTVNGNVNVTVNDTVNGTVKCRVRGTAEMKNPYTSAVNHSPKQAPITLNKEKKTL